MTHAMRLGFGDELFWAARVSRDDGFEVRIAEEATDLAAERISEACQRLGAQIADELGVPLGAARKKYRVLESTPRSDPEPPEKFMPPPKDDAVFSGLAQRESPGRKAPTKERLAANDGASS
jgi:hypothetical protein